MRERNAGLIAELILDGYNPQELEELSQDIMEFIELNKKMWKK